jgi:uncharacterized protein (TIRG00374 family)
VAPAPEQHHGFLRRHAAKLVASAIITVSIVYTLQKGGLKFIPDGGTFANARWWTVPVYVVTLAIMSYFRAVRWRYLLRSLSVIPRRRILSISMIGFAAILLMPFRLGEFVRPFMIREKGKISMSAATGTVVAERVVDGLYLSVILALALVFVPHLEPLPETVVGLPITVGAVRHAGFLMLFVFLTAFIVIGVFYFARGWAHRMTLAVFGLVSKKLGEKLAGVAERLADGLHAFGRARDAFGFLLETSLYWAFNVAGMWLLAWGFRVVHGDGSSITFGETCALMGMLGVTILIPGPPGLLGVFQAGIYAAMTMYFPTAVVTGQGAAYVFVLYLVQVAWTVTVALVFLFSGAGGGKGAMFAALSNADEQIGEGRGASELPPVSAP